MNYCRLQHSKLGGLGLLYEGGSLVFTDPELFDTSLLVPVSGDNPIEEITVGYDNEIE